MKIRHLVTFAVFLGIIAVFIGYLASLGIRVAPPANRVNLAMDVADINGIVVDSNVLLRGIPIGKVTAIETSVSTATIHFYVERHYNIPVDSDVRLDNLSALGESYVGLLPRSSGGPMLRDGQHIATESVKQPPSISELATSVVRVLNQLDPDALNRVIGEADTGLPDPNAVLPNLAHTSLLLRNTTADMHGQGQELLANLQSLLQNAGFVGPKIASTTPAVRDLGPPIQTLWNYAANGTLRNVPQDVYNLSALVGRFQKLLDDRGPDIRVLSEALLPNIKAIAASLQTFDSGQVRANILDAVPEDGAINLHVTIPPPGEITNVDPAPGG